jgi:single-stranded-DNA-specific exonuclease
VADVVPLDHNNRILVYHGLRRMRAGHCRPGILALLRVAGRSHERLQATDLGFVLGPRLNAAGRLDDMSIGIECLLTESEEAAGRLANELNRLNLERRQIEDEMQQQALALLDSGTGQGPGNDTFGLCLFDEDWHQGVIGILASRIKERYHRPVIAFAPAGENELKGSGRSIPGLHIRDALAEVAARHPDLLSKFGGHAMAAGLSLRRDDLASFSAAFDEAVRRQLSEDDLQARVATDGGIDQRDLTLELAHALREGGPWGQAFPPPLFDGEFECVSQRIVGERHWKLVLRQCDGDVLVDAIAFNQVEHFPKAPDRLRAAYQPDVNEFRGEQRLQLIIQHMEAL